MQFFSSEVDRQIRQLIRQCGRQARQLAQENYRVSQKGPDDYVTSVDRELDRQLSAGFSLLFPEDGTITEENERSRAAFTAGYRNLWCIDPLDGTEGFIHGEPHYAVMVGLLHELQPVAGWIYAPATDELFYGDGDRGLWQTRGDGDPQTLDPVEPLAPARTDRRMVIGDKDERNFGEAIARQIPGGVEFYSLGSFGLKVMEVICGRAGLYIYLNGRVKVWDTAGPVALARAAGLTCCDLDGNPLSFDPEAIAPDTLAHLQPILIGWPSYIEAWRSPIREAVLATSRP
ncbi:3'(2'),5'-bisphosphate nucleotidase CysQ family protein [Oxynema aestuarii]|jgi:3'(2'), 5'-bisphosphate nucleotidase|uniref:Inositol monophosphatase family protein n=1 Tax=Oxynema aestuarii AP17 TaxID=2064643 RepID=A0A6H1TSW9_9CYAN|nr:inositol monophosphatase family protein [Oxynema aestuarii]QIZ69306.1 inositol monophosphatase family protein [Oxynema aestuarii AP17]